MIVIGGLATVSGAVAGAAIITVVYEILRGVEEDGSLLGVSVPQVSGLAQMALAVVTLLILLFRPEGLLGYKEFEEWGRPPRGRGSGNGHVLRPEDVVKTFRRVQALRGVTLEVAQGEIVGLIGPNGQGKTTLRNVVSGVLMATSGRILVGERDVTRLRSERVTRLGVGGSSRTSACSAT